MRKIEIHVFDEDYRHLEALSDHGDVTEVVGELIKSAIHCATIDREKTPEIAKIADDWLRIGGLR